MSSRMFSSCAVASLFTVDRDFYDPSRPRGNGLWQRDDPSRDKFEVMPTEPEDGDGTSVTAVADLV